MTKTLEDVNESIKRSNEAMAKIEEAMANFGENERQLYNELHNEAKNLLNQINLTAKRIEEEVVTQMRRRELSDSKMVREHKCSLCKRNVIDDSEHETFCVKHLALIMKKMRQHFMMVRCAADTDWDSTMHFGLTRDGEESFKSLNWELEEGTNLDDLYKKHKGNDEIFFNYVKNWSAVIEACKEFLDFSTVDTSTQESLFSFLGIYEKKHKP